jgi:hypothetical protein
MTRQSICTVLVALVGCKGETVVKDNPDTLRDLDVCKRTLDEKNKLITAMQEEAARVRPPGEIVIAIEGNALTVKAGGGGTGGPRPIDDKQAQAASQSFLDVVARSRGAIQKCYEQALKKNQGLQGRTITLTVSASFSNAGAYQNASFSPSLGDVFDTCIKGVAVKWALPQNSPAMTFKAQVSLTPS